MLRQVLLLSILLFTTSCAVDAQRGHFADVDQSGWHQPTEINFEVDDMSNAVELQLALRYNSTISADSVELLVATKAPDGVMWSEPFTIYTPTDTSAFYVVESSFRRNVEWQQEGNYQILLHPRHNYQGITAVGVNIIK